MAVAIILVSFFLCVLLNALGGIQMIDVTSKLEGALSKTTVDYLLATCTNIFSTVLLAKGYLILRLQFAIETRFLEGCLYDVSFVFAAGGRMVHCALIGTGVTAF